MDPVLQYPSSPVVDYIFNSDSDSDSDNDSESDLLFPEFDLELSCGDCTDPISKGSDVGISQEVQSALATALSSQSLTPILKEELRCKIQLNRLLHGQEEITADFSEKSCSMSVEEIVKKNRKLEQNRMSAHKSRLKQKTLEENIKSRLASLERHNAWLGEQVKSLRHACSLARQWLGQHEECLQHTAKLVYAGRDQPSSQSLSSTDMQSVGVQHLLCAATNGQGSNV